MTRKEGKLKLTKAPRGALVRSGFRTPASTRRILVLTPTDSDTSAREARRRNEILDSHYQIAEQLNRATEMLQDLTGRHVPALRLEFDKRDTKNVPLDEFLNHFRHHEEVRIIIPLTKIPPAAATVAPADFGMTHLIGIETRDPKHGWHAGPAPYDAHVSTSQDRASAVIVDVALDIALSHSFDFLPAHGLFGAPLSVKKREFTVAQGYTTFYGNVDPSARYMSLAATVRRNIQFGQQDCKDYYQRWLEFMAWALLPSPVPADGILSALHQAEAPPSLTSKLLKWHRRGGQLSARDLEREIATLKSGTYILLVGERQPSNSRLEGRILAALRRKKWKSNSFAIRPFTERTRYIDLFPYLSMAAFEV